MTGNSNTSTQSSRRNLEVTQPTTAQRPWTVSCVRRLNISYPQTSTVTYRNMASSLMHSLASGSIDLARPSDTPQSKISTTSWKIEEDWGLWYFSKAFDEVPRERLMSKLLHCGVQGHTRRWIRHWLIVREQRVVVDGTESDPCSVTSGVPQVVFSDCCCF